MKFNESSLAALVDQESKLTAQLRDLSGRLMDMKESDKEWDTVRHREWDMRNSEHMRVEISLGRISRVRREMDSLRPRWRRENNEPPALNRWVARGSHGLTDEEQKEFLAEMDTDQANAVAGSGMPPGDVFRVKAEPGSNQGRMRMATRSDITTGAGSAGLAVEEEWDPEIIENLAYYGDVQRASTSFMTGTGGDYTVNALDGTAQKGVLLTDQADVIDATVGLTEVPLPPVTAVVFKAYTMHSGPMRVRREALEDVHFALEQRLDLAVMQRFGRGWLDYFTAGSGASQPLGIVTSAKAGITVASPTTVTYGELLNMEYAVDRAYRKGMEGGMGGFTGRNAGMQGWMMSDSTERILRSLMDDEGRPLWTPGITAGQYGIVDGVPPRLLGYEYQVNNGMDPFAQHASNDRYPLIFGAFGYFAVRTVGSMDVFRFFDSRTAQANSIEVLGFTRCDSRPLGAITTGAATCDAYAKLEIAHA